MADKTTEAREALARYRAAVAELQLVAATLGIPVPESLADEAEVL